MPPRRARGQAARQPLHPIYALKALYVSYALNVLTSDRETDLGGGPAFHSNLVEISSA